MPIDPWTGPAPTPQQFPRSYGPNDGITKLLDKIKAIETQLRDVRSHLPGSGGIGNDALTSPITTQSVYDMAQSFALSQTMTTKLTTTITVPAGATSADVSMMARMIAFNPNTTGGSNGAGADYFNVRPIIAGIDGFGMSASTGGLNGSTINLAPFATVLTGLTPGGTFDLTVKVATTFFAWSANALNTVITSGIIAWFR